MTWIRLARLVFRKFDWAALVNMLKPNVDWANIPAIAQPSALELFAAIANQRKYTLQLAPKKYAKGKPVEYHAIALPHGTNQKPIKGEGRSPEAAIFELWEKLNDCD